MFIINDELKKLPELPGIYIMRDADDKVIYVGKSKNLRNRVRSYFQPSSAENYKNKVMVPKIKSFEIFVTDSDIEALILENNLIKKYDPRYNVVLKDGRSYPYIKLTVKEDFPRVIYTYIKQKDNAHYFGPYPSGGMVLDLMDLIREIWPLRKCNAKTFPRSHRACVDHHIARCAAPCAGKVTKEEYRVFVTELFDFLCGKQTEIIKKLEKQMEEASENLEFEKALIIRDRIFAAKNFEDRQKLETQEERDRDVIAFVRSDDEALTQILIIRGGKMVGREKYTVKNAGGMSDGEVMEAFIMQFYGESPEIPPELIIQTEIEGRETVSEFLSKQRGGKVTITVPKKGEKLDLVKMALANANITVERKYIRESKETAKARKALGEIKALLGFDEGKKLIRIEAFDISNTQGFEPVASMVVFENGNPKKKDYRKFKIKTVTGADDTACMREVIHRRMERYLRERDEGTEEGKFSDLPDLILADGGRGQVGVCEDVLKEMGMDIPVCGMIKDGRHKTKGLLYNGGELNPLRTSEGFKLIVRIQDEVHRFAVEYHRKLREKKMVASGLDGIKGIGEARRKALINHFGSVEELKKASMDDMLGVSGMNAPAAKAVYAYFKEREK
jgi:excinuclease ABC subunit C